MLAQTGWGQLSPKRRMKRRLTFKGETMMDRLLRSFERKGQNECWPWTGSKDHGGYGRFWRHRSVQPKCTSAHRVLFELRYGRIPDGLQACHKCDNPGCVNPRHVFLGDHKANADDRDAKGRCQHGVRHWRCSLSESQVSEIRVLRAQGIAGPRLAKQFKVSDGTIYNIAKGRTHRWTALQPAAT